MMKIYIKTISLAVVTAVLFGCSKDRIDPDKNAYKSLSEYLNSKKQEEQEFTINEGGECPILGKEGTKICGSKDVLRLNGQTIEWPYTVRLIELLSVKEMIYYQHSNTNTAGFLTTDGEIKLTTYKDGQALAINTGSAWNVELPNSNPAGDMNIYYGTGGDDVSWGTSSSGTFAKSTYGYSGNVNTFGWIGASKQAVTAATTATFSFSSSTDELDNVLTYIYLSDKKSLVQVYDQSSIGLPIGENATIVMIGINSKDELFYYSSPTTVDGDTTFEVSLVSISDSNLTTFLNGL